MNKELARSIQERAGHRCEYCLLPQSAFPLTFQIDHVVASKHGGETIHSNLALACPHCNRYKGPNIAGIDPRTNQLVRLFHPRNDLWAEHFEAIGSRLFGKTPIGRATVDVLGFNVSDQLMVREELLRKE